MGEVSARPKRCRYEGCKADPTIFVDVDGEEWAFCAPHAEEAERDMEAQECADARRDFNKFAELVCTDDETGEPIRQAPIHRRWAELCEKYNRLLIWSHINSGKTTQLSILRTVWELGNDPTLRFAILSNVSGIAVKIVKAIAGYIKNNAAVHKIFPHLEPDPEGPWTNTELKVRRKNNAKDPSVRAVGVHGSLTSGRVDRLVVDDILDPENTDTDANRKKVEAWYKAVAVGRLTRRAKILVVGTAYHPKDLLHVLGAQKRWKWVRFPVINAKGVVAWPEYWPPERIAAMREELGPAEFARQLLCKARDEDEARFRKEWIDAALRRGEGLLAPANPDSMPEGSFYQSKIKEMPEGCATFTGVDLAVKKSKKADESAFFTFIERPNGDRLLLDVDAGKMSGPEIVQKIIAKHEAYQSIQSVENNAAQDFILQFARDISNVPVVPHTTTAAKRDPLLGIEGFAIELSNGKWIFPCTNGIAAPQVEALIQEMLYYTPKAHPGDRLMAAYFARERARKMRGTGTAKVTLKTLGTDMSKVVVKEGSFNERVNKVSEVSDEEARAKDGRAGYAA